MQWHKQWSFDYAPGCCGPGIGIRDGMCLLQDSGALAGRLNGWGVSNTWGLKTSGGFFTHMTGTQEGYLTAELIWDSQPGHIHMAYLGAGASLCMAAGFLKGESAGWKFHKRPRWKLHDFLWSSIGGKRCHFPHTLLVGGVINLRIVKEGTWTPSLSRSVKMPYTEFLIFNKLEQSLPLKLIHALYIFLIISIHMWYLFPNNKCGIPPPTNSPFLCHQLSVQYSIQFWHWRTQS